jgi:hypothetical protein
MWLLDSFTSLSKKVESELNTTINEGFSPVTSIANTIGNTIGSVTGGINESKKLAEQQAVADAKVEADKRQIEAQKTAELAAKEAKPEVNIDQSGNIVVNEDSQLSLGLLIAKYIVIVVFSFFFAMLVANQLIFLPKISRLLIFILVLIIPYIISPFTLIPFAIYYIGLMLWRIYLRSTPEYKDNKISLLPKIYCMLPLTTVEGTTSFARFFKYPFYFPKSEIAERRLVKEQGEYENSLIEHFYKWDEIVKKYPEFNTKFKELSEQFKKLITPVRAPIESVEQVVSIEIEASAPPAETGQQVENISKTESTIPT